MRKVNVMIAELIMSEDQHLMRTWHRVAGVHYLLNKTCSFQLQVCLSMCDLLVDTSHENVKVSLTLMIYINANIRASDEISNRKFNFLALPI